LKIATESGDPEIVAAVTLEVNAWRDTQRAAREERASEERDDDNKRGRRQRGRDRNDRPEKKERPAYVSREQAREQSREPGRETGREQRREPSRERERDSRDDDAPRGGTFNLPSTLRQIEAQFQILRNELSTAQAKLRKADVPRRTDRVSLSVEESNLSPDEL